MPANTVYVGRPTKWGNPYELSKHPRQYALAAYEQWLVAHYNMNYIREELSGKNLACWCPLDKPCHADILLRAVSQNGGSKA